MFSKHRLNLQNIALNLPVLQRNMFSPLPLVSVSKKVAENEFLIFVGKCALPKYDLYVPQICLLQTSSPKLEICNVKLEKSFDLPIEIKILKSLHRSAKKLCFKNPARALTFFKNATCALTR